MKKVILYTSITEGLIVLLSVAFLAVGREGASPLNECETPLVVEKNAGYCLTAEGNELILLRDLPHEKRGEGHIVQTMGATGMEFLVIMNEDQQQVAARHILDRSVFLLPEVKHLDEIQTASMCEVLYTVADEPTQSRHVRFC